MSGLLSDIQPSDTEGVKWAKLGAWMQLLANNIGGGGGGGDLLAANNLSDVASAGTSRDNLGLGTLATQNGAFSGTSSGANTGDQTNISGNAATVTTNANLTGPVTSAGNATAITDAAVTLAKLANLAQDQVIIRTTASTGVPETATITAAARTVLDDATVAAMVDTLGGAAASGTGGIARTTNPTLVTPIVTTSITGTGALTLAAGGTAQNITLTPSTTGKVMAPGGSATVPGFTLGGSTISGFAGSDNDLFVISAGIRAHFLTNGYFFQGSAGRFGWTDSSDAAGTRDTGLNRNAAGVVEINNSNAGTFRDLKLRNLTPTGGNGLAVATVGTLPVTAATGLFTGSGFWVTDALAPAFGAVVAAGGAAKCPVHYDGSNWLVS